MIVPARKRRNWLAYTCEYAVGKNIADDDISKLDSRSASKSKLETDVMAVRTCPPPEKPSCSPEFWSIDKRA